MNLGLDSTTIGYIAVTCFLLLTGIGAGAQVHKLTKRTLAWKQGELERDRVCDGLHPVRETWSLLAFTLFALTGLTRTYIDCFLLLSRIPVVILTTTIIWFLQYHGENKTKRFFLLAIGANFILAFLIILAILGYRFDHTIIPSIVNGSLSVVSLLLFYGKLLQAFTMYRQRRSLAVSWLRESGLVIKDLTGLWYTLSVGNELLWVSVTHILSGISSTTICVVKFLVERAALRQKNQSPTK